MHEMSLFPEVLWPFNYLTLTQNKPSEFSECYRLFDHFCLTMMNFMYTHCIPMQIKPNKSLSRQGTGPALSFTERAAMSSLFLHRISIVRVNLSHLIRNAVDTAGWCLHRIHTRNSNL